MDYEKLSSDPRQDFVPQGLCRLGEPSAAVRKRVEAARERQRARFEGTGLACNADSVQPPRGIAEAIQSHREASHYRPRRMV